MASHVYNASWYSDNEGRKYPLDSSSSAISDTGLPLNHGILADLHIVFPDTLGNSVMVAGITITDYMLTIVFCTKTMPLASLTVQQRVQPFYHYELNPLQDDVTGVVVFGGEALTARGSWMFSSLKQSAILPTCFTRLAVFPVESIGIANGGSPLTGDVFFTPGSDIHMEIKDSQVVPGVEALWIGLDTLNNNKTDILKKYIGPCDTRPDSDTCSRTSVSSIGGVSPDCAGSINIVGEEGITVTASDNKIIISSNKILPEVCPAYSIGEYVGESNCVVYTTDEEITATAPLAMAASLPNAVQAIPTVNLYTSRVQVETGGLEYGDSRGVTNVSDSGPATFAVTIPDSASAILMTIQGSGAISIRDGIHTLYVTDSSATYDGNELLTINFPLIVHIDTNVKLNQQDTEAVLDIHSLHITLQGAYCSDIYYE